MKVSIIIPMYNASAFISKAINSLKKQSFKNIEVIIVDDGSTDNSFEVCNNCIGIDERFKLFRKENGGVSSARNFGLDKAEGDFISFLDADDYIDNCTIEECVRLVTKCNVDIVKFNYKKELGIIKVKSKKIVEHDRFIDFPFDDVLDTLFENDKFCSACECMISSKIAKRHRFKIGITLGEDFLYFTECLLDSSKMYITNKAYYHYVVNTSSATHTFNAEKCLDSINNVITICNDIVNNVEKRTGVTLDPKPKIFRTINSVIDLGTECGTEEERTAFLDLVENDEMIKKYIDSNHSIFEKKEMTKKKDLKIRFKKLIKSIILHS